MEKSKEETWQNKSTLFDNHQIMKIGDISSSDGVSTTEETNKHSGPDNCRVYVCRI